mgnify:CR=1 FL=1
MQMRNLLKAVLVTAVILSLGIAAVGAQDDPEVIASDLNAPRHVFYAADGTLYIAEAGMGGEMSGSSGMGGGNVSVGFTARVSTVSAEGEQGVFIDELFSTADDFGSVEGVSAVYTDDQYAWLVMGIGTSRETAPPDAIFSALVQVDLATLDILNVIDLLAFEEANNPDNTQEIASNPQDIAVAEDGTVYIIDASGNSLLRIVGDQVELFHVWEVDESGQTPSPVPTSIELAEDGSIYVGFLSGFPFLPGAARIEQWSADGELINTIEGLTLVTDLAMGQDGNLYAVQFANGFGDMGYNAETGSVVMIAEDGTITPVIEGLNFPYGIAQAADGSWAVTLNSAFSAPGTGEVIRIGGGM